MKSKASSKCFCVNILISVSRMFALHLSCISGQAAEREHPVKAGKHTGGQGGL